MSNLAVQPNFLQKHMVPEDARLTRKFMDKSADLARVNEKIIKGFFVRHVGASVWVIGSAVGSFSNTVLYGVLVPLDFTAHVLHCEFDLALTAAIRNFKYTMLSAVSTLVVVSAIFIGTFYPEIHISIQPVSFSIIPHGGFQSADKEKETADRISTLEGAIEEKEKEFAAYKDEKEKDEKCLVDELIKKQTVIDNLYYQNMALNNSLREMSDESTLLHEALQEHWGQVSDWIDEKCGTGFKLSIEEIASNNTPPLSQQTPIVTPDSPVRKMKRPSISNLFGLIKTELT